MMNNKYAQSKLIDCQSEIQRMKILINKDKFNSANQYIIKHAIVFLSGSIEVATKTIIADKVSQDTNTHICSYIDKTIRDSSMNPSLYNIRRLTNKINKKWAKKIDKLIDETGNKTRLEASLNNVVDNRNSIAHGGKCEASIENIFEWCTECIEIVKIIDKVIYEK